MQPQTANATHDYIIDNKTGSIQEAAKGKLSKFQKFIHLNIVEDGNDKSVKHALGSGSMSHRLRIDKPPQQI